ncbi:hypothetical protein VO54_02040 [Elizabethkingia miricola]|nr:hypothetical protein VO54_02040 [Elizabethkingia miricola]
MKKQNINKKLLFKKEIIMDLKSVTGGQAPYTQKVDTYKCPAGSVACDNDPVPNKYTCDCGHPFDDSAACPTLVRCSPLHTLLAGGCSTVPPTM